MAVCFCGFDHSKKMDKKLKLLSEAYCCLYQRAHPDKEWMEQVRKLQVKPKKKKIPSSKNG